MFRNWVLQNFPFLEDNFDALTDYELFCKICGYVIEYSKDNEEMKKKIEEFQTYFDNLDVQEEINNKLDEMASDGTLAEIINQEIFGDLNDKVDNNKKFELADNTQCNISDIDLTSIFSSDYAVTSVNILTINGNKSGIIIANDWSEGGSQGNKFTIKTFDYNNNTLTNINTRYELLDGHSNSMCKIDNTHVLIVAMTNNYVYDLEHNTYKEITGLPYCRSCADYKGKVYVSTDYNHVNDEVVNALYEISFDENYDPILVHTYTVPNLYNKIQMRNQGMVIYNDLLIYITYANSRLVIYDFNTLNFLKTQLFTAPYIPEYEDGFVYNDDLMLVGGDGSLYLPDIFDKTYIGSYTENCITKSMTNICLIDNVVKLSGTTSPSVTLKLNKYFEFHHLSDDTNIGIIGGMLDSITIYGAVRNYKTAVGTNNIIPIEIPMYKGYTYGDDVFNWYEKKWSTNYCYWDSTDNTFHKSTICGTLSFGGGDSVPTITITMAPYILNEVFKTDGTETIEMETDSDYEPEFYITKIIGHRKVGLHY